MPRKLTSEDRKMMRTVSEMFVKHGDGADNVVSANTTVNLLDDLDDDDAEIERLRNALIVAKTFITEVYEGTTDTDANRTIGVINDALRKEE